MNINSDRNSYILSVVCILLGCLGFMISILGIVPGLFAVTLGHYLLKMKSKDVSSKKLFPWIGLITGYLACVFSLRYFLFALIKFISYDGDIDAIKVDNVNLDINNIRYAVISYSKNEGDAPKTLSALTDGKDKYFSHPVSNDAWGTPYRYILQDNKYTISSAGKDKIFDTNDDIAVSGHLKLNPNPTRAQTLRRK